MYALAAPHEARSMRSAGAAPVRDHPSADKSAFAFTTPLSLEHPMARAHVKLLGPCFKTGRRDRRTTRDRDATRTSSGCSIYEAAQIPAPVKARNRGLPRQKSPKNFTPALGPTRAVRRVRRRRSAAANRPNQKAVSLRITNPMADQPSA